MHNVIRQAGSDGISKTELNEKVKHKVKGFKREPIIKELLSDGRIRMIERKSSRGKAAKVFIAIKLST